MTSRITTNLTHNITVESRDRVAMDIPDNTKLTAAQEIPVTENLRIPRGNTFTVMDDAVSGEKVVQYSNNRWNIFPLSAIEGAMVSPYVYAGGGEVLRPNQLQSLNSYVLVHCPAQPNLVGSVYTKQTGSSYLVNMATMARRESRAGDLYHPVQLSINIMNSSAPAAGETETTETSE